MYLSFFRIIQANINAQARSAQAFKTTVKSKSLFCLQEKKGIGLIGCILSKFPGFIFKSKETC